MKAEELIDAKYMWTESTTNFSILVWFRLQEENEKYFIEYRLIFDPEERTWHYIYEKSDNVSFPKYKEEAMQKRVENLTKRKREKREQRMLAILDTLVLTTNYVINPHSGFKNRKEVFVKGATVGGEEIDFSWVLIGDSTIELSFRWRDREVHDHIYFSFTYDFSKKHLKPFREFENFLRTKSKDRLKLLF